MADRYVLKECSEIITPDVISILTHVAMCGLIYMLQPKQGQIISVTYKFEELLTNQIAGFQV